MLTPCAKVSNVDGSCSSQTLRIGLNVRNEEQKKNDELLHSFLWPFLNIRTRPDLRTCEMSSVAAQNGSGTILKVGSIFVFLPRYSISL